jgi:hypothetical protein
MEPATFRLVAQCLNQLRQHLPPHEVMQFPQLSSEVEREQNNRNDYGVWDAPHVSAFFILASHLGGLGSIIIRDLGRTKWLWVKLLTDHFSLPLSVTILLLLHNSFICHQRDGSLQVGTPQWHGPNPVTWEWQFVANSRVTVPGTCYGDKIISASVYRGALHSYACIPFRAWT